MDDLLAHGGWSTCMPWCASVRVSQPSYGLKKLEPLYMGEHLRESEVKSVGDSLVAYAAYRELRDTGEAAAAAAQLGEIADILGLGWVDPADPTAPRPLGERDILVVAPYNAQVAMIRRTLSAAGLDAVRVGTVDEFQGQEAPVAIVSMIASAPQDVPRGMSFLLSRNRVNVAISRGQWCAIVIRSPRLTDYLPKSPSGLGELGAFIGLCTPD